ncbi:hypothetical protein GQ53DRAFT_402532 [Thozetella sp. PMI_491]|nr:hypothetical protein GQ53DRAFT_402532 [Thozetella sp. PMI_491]
MPGRHAGLREGGESPKQSKENNGRATRENWRGGNSTATAFSLEGGACLMTIDSGSSPRPKIAGTRGTQYQHSSSSPAAHSHHCAACGAAGTGAACHPRHSALDWVGGAAIESHITTRTCRQQSHATSLPNRPSAVSRSSSFFSPSSPLDSEPERINPRLRIIRTINHHPSPQSPAVLVLFSPFAAAGRTGSLLPLPQLPSPPTHPPHQTRPLVPAEQSKVLHLDWSLATPPKFF